MLNKNCIRELAYVVRIDSISPMDADRLECAHVGGWNVVVGKGEFKPNDLAVYFEIDSQLPEVKPFIFMTFLAQKHFKIRSQKIRGVISQGLLVSAENLGWTLEENAIIDSNGNPHRLEDESRFLTDKLGVIYATASDNVRKGKTQKATKYSKMASRHQKLAKTWLWRQLYNTAIGKEILFFFFGKKKDKRVWLDWVVKTDEERCQNLSWLFDPRRETQADKWFVTEKIDGTSVTFTMKAKEKKLYVCSRNVVFEYPSKTQNLYLEVANKYVMQIILTDLLEENPNWDYITLQGEIYGDGIQQRTYSLTNGEHKLAIFNVIYGYTKNGVSYTCKLNPDMVERYGWLYNFPTVPVLDYNFTMPSSCDELLREAHGVSKIDGGPREGLVIRSEDMKVSFKAVDNEFILKYHR